MNCQNVSDSPFEVLTHGKFESYKKLGTHQK